MHARDPQTLTHVFLATPYGQWMDWDRGAVRSERIAYLAELRRALLDAGHAVFSAHHNEEWGQSWLPASVCTPADFLAVRRCDVLVAVLGRPPSPGVLVELGWASALGKPIVLLVEGDAPPLVAGLLAVTTVVPVDDVRPDCWPSPVLAATLDAVRELHSHQPSPLSAVPGYPVTSLPLGYEAPAPANPEREPVLPPAQHQELAAARSASASLGRSPKM